MLQYKIQNLSVFDQNILQLFGLIHTCCGMPLLLVVSRSEKNEFNCSGETSTSSTYYMKQLPYLLDTRRLVTIRRSRVCSHDFK